MDTKLSLDKPMTKKVKCIALRTLFVIILSLFLNSANYTDLIRNFTKGSFT